MSVFDNSGGSTRTLYTVYKVITQKGAQGWGDIAVGWQPWHEGLPTLKARVIAADYSVRELDPKTITDAPAKEDESNVFSDRRVVRAPLPAIAPGSVVEQEIVLTERVPFPGSGIIDWIPFGRVSVPVQHTRVVFDAPSSVSIQYVLKMLPDLTPQRSEADGRVKIVFDRGPIPAYDDPESYMPSDALVHPFLVFSTASSWQQVAQGYAKIVEDHISPVEVKGLVEKLTAGKTASTDKEQAILQYLDKEVRYTGVEFGEANVVPHAPAQTLARKYGDCKDKAALLVAMLRAAQIPAYVALLNTSWRSDVPPELPGAGLFDHAIVYVPGDQDLWIDPTDEYARLGQLPLSDQGRLALVVRAESSALLRTPEAASPVNAFVESREIDLAENGPARVLETTRPQGCFESEYRRSFVDKQDKHALENLTKYVQWQYRAEKLDRWDRSDPTDISRQFELVLESDKAKRGFTDLENAAVAIRLEGLFTRLPDELQRREDTDENKGDTAKPKKRRTFDYQLPEPFNVEWQYTIVPPLGFQPKPLPQDAKISLGPALLTEQFAADSNGTVHAAIRFDTVKRRFSVAEATEMRNKVAELSEGEAILINFEPLGQALWNQGKGREAFQSYRSLIAQHPKEAVHHLQMAQALLEGGMGEAARDEARLAVSLEPNSALAEKTLGQILEYDLVGRKFRAGSDYAGAAAAFRAAAKLDPEDKAVVGNLAGLLEYNQDGERYRTGAPLKEAIAEYRALSQQDLASLGLESDFAYALFYAGEIAESRKLAETLNPQPKALIVACEAVMHGSQAAIQEANKLSGGDAELKQHLKYAGNFLEYVRNYSLAADLLEVGASGDDAARTMGLASALRKARRHEEIQFGNTPADAAMEFLMRYLYRNPTIEQENKLRSKNGRIELQNTPPWGLDDRLEVMRQSRRVVRDKGALDVNADLMMQVEPTGEGNDSSGYRETHAPPGWVKHTVYVVKEEGRYKVLSAGVTAGAVGLEVLDRVAAQDLNGARVLLDWVRDEQHLEGGDDPLSGQAFPRFWAKGKQADADQIRLAAAALLVQVTPTAKEGVAIFEKAMNSIASEPDRTNVNIALLTGYGNLYDYEKMLGIASELAKQYPDSKRALIGQCQALRGLGRFEEANGLTREWLKRMPDDLDAMRILRANAIGLGDYRGAYDVSRKLVDTGKVEYSDLNDMAWLTLFYDRAEGPDIATALKADQLHPDDYHTLHTLGCLYAVAGKTKEARDVLIQAMNRAHLDEPTSDFWYAFGLLAEQYGEREVAMADYGRVTKPRLALQIPESSYYLAQRRLNALQSTSSPSASASKR
jgi:transglutaminase-like putative cysteine protease/Flp pilus assembly protein TadD